MCLKAPITAYRERKRESVCEREGERKWERGVGQRKQKKAGRIQKGLERLTFDIKSCSDGARRMCWYLALIQSFITFISVGDSQTPVVWIFKFDAKSFIKCVCVNANCEQLNVRIILFTFQPCYLERKLKNVGNLFYWSVIFAFFFFGPKNLYSSKRKWICRLPWINIQNVDFMKLLLDLLQTFWKAIRLIQI